MLEVPKTWGTVGSWPLGMGVWLPPRNMLLPTCYHTRFHHCRLSHFGIGRGSRNFLGCWDPAPLGCGRGWPLEICFCPRLCYSAKFVHSRSNCTSVITEICQKVWSKKWKRVFLQHFDSIGWVTGRASSLWKILHEQTPKVLLWNTVRGPWSGVTSGNIGLLNSSQSGSSKWNVFMLDQSLVINIYYF